MKNLMMTLAMVLVGATAHASMVESYATDLKTFSFQKGSVLQTEMQKSIVSGSVSITPISDITLSLYHRYNCKAGMMCPAIAYAPVTYQVSFKSSQVGDCGEKIYVGESDNRLVDGTMTQITVVDNSTNTCESFVAFPLTEVKLVIEGGGRSDIHETHSFTGAELKESM